jgi:uncharacterized membrane protein SirB2
VTEYYPEIRWTHVAAVLASGSLFFFRAVAGASGASWTLAAPLRILAYGIDSVLLTAALMLLSILNLNPFTVPWLAVKLLLLVAYIALGFMALRAGQVSLRLAFGLAAVGAFLLMFSVARAHHPLGLFRAWIE